MKFKHSVFGNIHQAKGKVNDAIGILTNDEIEVFKGDIDKLTSHLQKKYGIPFEQARIAADRMLTNYW